MPNYYPVYLDLRGRRCVVIGGGDVAERKVENLLESGGKVTVISPEVTPMLKGLAGLGKIQWEERGYRGGDLAGAFLSIAATDSSRTNEMVAKEVETQGGLLNVVDVTHLCNFIAPAIVRRGPVTVAISTSGTSPALARKLKNELAKSNALEYADLAEVLAKARADVRRRGLSIPPDHWQECIDEELLAMCQRGEKDEAKRRLISLLEKGANHQEERR